MLYKNTNKLLRTYKEIMHLKTWSIPALTIILLTTFFISTFGKMRKYAIVIRKFQRRLNIAISDFLDIGVYGFEEDFENKEEDDDSKLAVYDPWYRDRIENTKEDEDKEEDKEEEDDDNYYRRLFWR
jgi:hypothetical protein